MKGIQPTPSLIGRIVRRVALKSGFRFFRPGVLQAYHQAVEWEKLPNDEVAEKQLHKLNAVLDCHLQRDWFRDHWYAHGGPSYPLRSLEEYRQFTGVTRAYLMENYDRVATSDEAVRELSTSGSSGENLFFHQSQEMVDGRTAVVRRSNQWVDFDNWGDRCISVWGLSPSASLRYRATSHLKLFAFGGEMLSAYGMTDKDALEYARVIVQRKPVALNAYPSYLAQVARAALAAGFAPWHGAVITWGGEQALPQDLEAIHAFFGDRVYARYGTQEFGTIAHQVPWRKGYVVTPTRFLVDSSPDGELLITDLDNRATPFLRYRVGDAGTVGATAPDEPGRQIILDLEGRSHDRIETPSGRLLPGQFWTLLSRVVPGIIEFQILHNPPCSICMRLVVNDARFPQDGEVKITERAIALLGDEMNFSVELTDELDRTSRGKRRFIIRRDDSTPKT